MSSADSRSPITDALETLGFIHFKPEKRDAIHLAVEPVRAGVDLSAGQHVKVVDGVAWPAPYAESHGIVDPFLPWPPGKNCHVQAGESFWFIMKPRMVRSLRHVWEHPAFPEGV